MLARNASDRLIPVFQSTLVVVVGLLKALRMALFVLLTHAVTDIPLLACAAAVVWGIHFWSIPSAWIAGGVMGFLFMIFTVKPLR